MLAPGVFAGAAQVPRAPPLSTAVACAGAEAVPPPPPLSCQPCSFYFLCLVMATHQSAGQLSCATCLGLACCCCCCCCCCCRDTLDWRARERPDLLYCQACLKDPTSHYMHVVGWDRQRRPVIYSCLELATNRRGCCCSTPLLLCFLAHLLVARPLPARPCVP